MNDENLSINVKIYDSFLKKIVLEPIEELVKRMVASQMPVSFEAEALKAQAIIARTFIVRNMQSFGGYGCSKYKNADLCTDGHCGNILSVEVLKKEWGDNFKKNWEKINCAVMETEGNIITINNKPIYTKFHATCGGATENSENVEGNKTVYLRKVLCDYCKDSPRYRNSMEISLKEIEKRLNIKTLKPSSVKGPVMEGIIEDIERDEEGRIISVKIGGKKLKGTEVMKLLGLSSTRGSYHEEHFIVSCSDKEFLIISTVNAPISI
ncbi:MAG: SpoIID/LytB domain-containing protein [Marinisporobacter sp.]|nr:SpoIID/LytB domain-containing protein [Marinisporobacter sp.]